ncbi:MAG: glycosyltransferase family 4 protein [Bacteroidales bacterium]|nr:glycosyltransferase family 4 protein [Bacteroidales bacterium]
MKQIPKVLFVGDSLKMKGGVSAVIQAIASTPLWTRYQCRWLECQINAARWKKWAYLLRALWRGLFWIPRFEIIHFHSAVGNSLKVQLPFLLYALLWRKKILVHFHVGDQLREAASDRLFRFYCRKADQVLTLGKRLREEIPTYASHPGRVGYLYNPVPPLQKKTEREPFFLMAAYLTPDQNKGCDTVLEAFAAFRRAFPDWKLVICGSGDMEGLRSLIVSNGLQACVETPGWVSGSEKERYFRQAAAYCMASHKEGLPVSILESISAGLPIITTPVGSIPEILQDRESALFFQPGDAVTLCRLMTELAADPDLGNRMAGRASAFAEEQMVLEHFTRRLSAYYEQLYPTHD